MAESGVAYRYTVPLTSDGQVEKPAYDCLQEDSIYSRYGTSAYVLVCENAIPHFHRNSVNVQVEEVNPDDHKGDN